MNVYLLRVREFSSGFVNSIVADSDVLACEAGVSIKPGA
jgi:hypothetical protein